MIGISKNDLRLEYLLLNRGYEYPLTVPAVPTGIKIGVSIFPCAVLITPALALEFSETVTSSKFINRFLLKLANITIKLEMIRRL